MSIVSLATSGKNPLKVAIVGGGIGGLTLAIALHRAGVDFHIYEAAHQFSEIGAGVGLAHNAQQAMELIDPDLKAAYDRHATYNDDAHRDLWFVYRMGIEGRKGTNTEGFKPGQVIASPKGIHKGVVLVHRSRFLDELVAMVPKGSATFAKRLQKLDQSGPRPRLFFTDGTVAEADIVIGCDGVKSAVRASLFGPESAARFSGKYAYRGLLPMSSAAAIVGQEQARNSQAYVGYGAHVLTMAIDGGETMNVVAFQTKKDGVWDNEKWVLPLQREEMEHDFADWSEDVRKLLGLLEKTDKWALFENPPLPTLYKGKACLLGDAAHATTPHQGSGAGMAIEDAYILGLLIGAVRDQSEVGAAFAAYDSVRLARTEQLVKTSHEAGDVYEFLDPNIRDNIEKLQEDLEQRFTWIYEADLAAMGTEALDLFNKGK